MRPSALCGLLAEQERLRAFSAVVLGAATPSEVAERAGLPAREAVRALRRLEQGGLLTTVEGKLVANTTAFKQAINDKGYESESSQPRLDPFIRSRAKRLAALEQIAAAFEPGVRYPEKDVNEMLRSWHPDYAALRRHLVDEGLMSRDRGVYWRSGGPVEL